jgi:hypothetical protein
MAIIDHSRGTEFIARSLTKGGGDSIRKQITGGMLPEEKKEEIVSLIKTRVEENNGVVPNELYTEVANLIYPYAAIPVPTLERILSATNFFGLTGKQPNVGKVGYKGATEKLVKNIEETRSRVVKSLTPKGRTAAPFSPIEVGDEPESLIDNAARVMSGAGPEDTIELVTPKTPLTRSPPLQIGKEDGTQDLDPGSNYVSSYEEMEAEMVTITRDVTTIVVHFSETYTNANLSKDNVPGSGKYHYIVRRDGSVQRDQGLNSAPPHTGIGSFDAHSIGVCLVGGLSVASGEEAVGPEVDASSITRSQYNAMYAIFDAFFRVWPGGQALGHSEIDPEMQDPGFDVRDYVFAKFKKISLYENPEQDDGLSKDDVLERQAGNGGVPILSKDPDVEEKYQ